MRVIAPSRFGYLRSDFPVNPSLAEQADALVAAGVWLLDEPLDALDDEGVNGLTRWWQAHRERGGAVVMSSHQALPLLPQVRRLHLSPQGAHGAQHGQAA